MRVNPPVASIPRQAVRDFQFKGHHIPAGTRVAINVIFTHRMPEIWPEPDKFDPSAAGISITLTLPPRSCENLHRSISTYACRALFAATKNERQWDL
jgi:Cytochrome P450